jgi:hypothetical protein
MDRADASDPEEGSPRVTGLSVGELARLPGLDPGELGSRGNTRNARGDVRRMSGEAATGRLLGGAVLFVFLASLASERLLASTVGSGDISEIMVNIRENPTRIRLSSLMAILNSLGIVVLACLLYSVFRDQFRIIALVALGWWLAEAVVLAVSKVGTYALIPLSQDFVVAGLPEASHFQALGSALYFGVGRLGYDIHMAFFCLGGMLWYYLLFSSRAVPAPLSLWGLTAVTLLAVLTFLGLSGRSLDKFLLLGLPYAPYELVLGMWLLIKGFG